MPPSNALRIAFLGDIVGRPGRRVVEQQLPRVRSEHHPDIVIANAENARSGSGLTPAQYAQFREIGIDAMTMGDHVFREPKILDLLQQPSAAILRPLNLPAKSPGKASLRIERPGRPAIDLVTVLGRIFFPLPADDPFAAVDRWLESLGDPSSIRIVEAHMEATSEKHALARYLDGRVSAVIGTHTHVPTADARVLPKGTAFITDVGMCGPYESILGRGIDPVIRHMTTALRVNFDVAEGDERLCGAVLEIDERSKRATRCERIEYRADRNRAPFTGGGSGGGD